MDFPALPSAEIDEPAGLAAALGATPVRVARGTATTTSSSSPTPRRSARSRPTSPPSLAIETRAVVVTALADDGNDEGADFVSRCFAPRVGIDEDPVTGSAHCALGAVVGGPARPHRAGRLPGVGAWRHRPVSTSAATASRLGGHAVTVLRGELAD